MIRCYRDKHGFLRVDVGDEHPSIGRFLEGDIQGSANVAKEYLTGANDVQQGRLPEWSCTGNAHTVTIRPGGVTIENEWDEDIGVAELSIDQFKQALKTWLQCISPPEQKGDAAG